MEEGGDGENQMSPQVTREFHICIKWLWTMPWQLSSCDGIHKWDKRQNDDENTFLWKIEGLLNHLISRLILSIWPRFNHDRTSSTVNKIMPIYFTIFSGSFLFSSSIFFFSDPSIKWRGDTDDVDDQPGNRGTAFAPAHYSIVIHSRTNHQATTAATDGTTADDGATAYRAPAGKIIGRQSKEQEQKGVLI